MCFFLLLKITNDYLFLLNVFFFCEVWDMLIWIVIKLHLLYLLFILNFSSIILFLWICLCLLDNSFLKSMFLHFLITILFSFSFFYSLDYKLLRILFFLKILLIMILLTNFIICFLLIAKLQLIEIIKTISTKVLILGLVFIFINYILKI